MAFDGLLGAPPQFAGLVVPHDVGVVVVAVRAQRLAEPGVVAVVPGEAGERAAVRAGLHVAAGVAGLGPAGAAGPVGAGVLADRAGVDGAEGGGGEGGEDGRVGGDGGGDAFAADESGADEVVGVAAVGFGAAGAGGGAAVAAGLVHHLVGHGVGGDGAQEFAGGGVDVLDLAAEPDGVGAGGGVPDVVEPGEVAVSGAGQGVVGGEGEPRGGGHQQSPPYRSNRGGWVQAGPGGGERGADVGVPAGGVTGAVRAVEMTGFASWHRGLMPGGEGPGHGVGGGEQVPAADQAADLDAESVQPGQAAGVQGVQDQFGLGGGLAAADGSDADERFGGQVDPGAVVGVGAAQVVARGPALQDRDDRQAGVGVAEVPGRW